MPRYFFHSRDGGLYHDPDGAELPDLRAAGLEAVRYLAELLREEPDGFWRAGELQLTIADAEGAALCVLILTRSGACGAPDADPGGP